MSRRDNFAAAQARRWMRPNAHLFVRPDAWRFMSTSTPRFGGKDAVRYFWPDKSIDGSRARFERKYSPDQPRVPAGRPDGGQWTSEEGNIPPIDEGAALQSPLTQLAGMLIRICIASARSLSTDQWGNKSYRVTYDCAGGRSFTLSGPGHDFPGIVIDPFQ